MSRPATKAGLILEAEGGHGTSNPYHSSQHDIPELYKYNKGKMTDEASVFVVYPQKDFSQATGVPDGIVVESTDIQDLNMTVRSAQGFDRAGIILFAHPKYGGNGQLFSQTEKNITKEFPPDTWDGVNSFLVYEGVWSLFLGPDLQGAKVTIDGRDQFGPGTKVENLSPYAVDQVRSIQNVS